MKSKPSLSSIIIPGLIGNILEWYDFALYGYFASILSPLFFPSSNPVLSLLMTFSIFAIGFIMRPIGAIIFGHYGDRFGRKKALSSAILLMAIPTTLIGFLPTYQQAGLLAPLLLTCCRLVQGLAVGGEFTASIVYILEHSPPKRRGFYGSLTMSSAFIGLLLGSTVATLFSWLMENSVQLNNLWRLAFAASIILGIVGLYLRIKMPESPLFLQQAGKSSKNPIKYLVLNYKSTMLLSIAVVLLPSANFYLSFVFLSNYINTQFDQSLHHTLLINTVTMLMIVLLIPIFGALSDIWGRKSMILSAAIATSVLSIPLYLLLSYHQHSLAWVQMIFAMLVALSYASIPAYLVELYPTLIRVTSLSLVYNLANAMFGGTAPLIATSLIHWSSLSYAPGIYLTILALITIGAALGFGKSTGQTADTMLA